MEDAHASRSQHPGTPGTSIYYAAQVLAENVTCSFRRCAPFPFLKIAVSSSRPHVWMRCKSSNCTGILGRFRWSKCVLWQLHNMQRKARPDGHLTTLRRHAMFPKEDPPACYVVPLEMSAGGWTNDLAHFRFCLDQRLFLSIKPSGRSQSQEGGAKAKSSFVYTTTHNYEPILRKNSTLRYILATHGSFRWTATKSSQGTGPQTVASRNPAI